jgi:response regulator NasT
MGRSLRIAVADDDPHTCECYRRLLALLGHEVVAVQTGRALVECCAAVRPDLVITDIRMPDMDGIEAAERIHRDRPVPVILVSGYRDPELVERAERSHALAYLVKPVDADQLAPAIALAVRRFEEFQALHREVGDLRQTLEDRKVIERAKGAVMRRLSVNEEDAFRRLRKLAADHKRKVVEVARDVLAAEEVFARLESARH